MTLPAPLRRPILLGLLALTPATLLAAAPTEAWFAGYASLVAAEYGLAGTGQRVLLVSGFSADPTRHAPSVTVVTV